MSGIMKIMVGKYQVTCSILFNKTDINIQIKDLENNIFYQKIGPFYWIVDAIYNRQELKILQFNKFLEIHLENHLKNHLENHLENKITKIYMSYDPELLKGLEIVNSYN